MQGRFEDAGGFYTLQKIASESVGEQHCGGARELPVRWESTLSRSAADRGACAAEGCSDSQTTGLGPCSLHKDRQTDMTASLLSFVSFS